MKGIRGVGLAWVKFKHVPSRYKPEDPVRRIRYDTIRYSTIHTQVLIIVTLAWTFFTGDASISTEYRKVMRNS